MKKTLIILVILTLIFFFLQRTTTIYNSKGEAIFGKSLLEERLEKDGSYIFFNNIDTLKVNVTNNKRIEQKKLSNSEFKVNSATGNVTFNVRLNNCNKYENNHFFSTDSIIAISDMEGNFNVFTQFLKANKVIDSQLNWIYGKGHLVCNGDFFDRGNDVNALLWLIYRLEQQAFMKGGRVHFILGNHEEMNIRGEVKYVHNKYKSLAKKLNIPYKELYGKDTEIGKWLRTKKAIVQINSILFTHGGLSPDIVNKKYSIEEINHLTNSYVGFDKDYLNFINPRASFIFDRKGPMWYRGYFGDYKEYYKEIKSNELDKILDYYQAKHIVVGHTIVDKVKTLFNNRIIAIDAMSEDDPRKNDDDNMAISCEGLFIENNHFYRVLFNGKREFLFRTE